MADKTGLYALHHVCIRGQFDNEADRSKMVTELIQAGANVNMATTNTLSSALHITATKNQPQIAKLLLDTRKCAVNAKNKQGKTAYEVAEDEDHEEVMDVIDKHRDKVHLIRATREGTVEDVINALYQMKANPNMADKTGIYPLHHVCVRGEFDKESDRLQMVKELIQAGANVNAKTVNTASSALHIAATKNQPQIAKILLDTRKCAVSAKNKQGMTAYEIAEEEEHEEVMDVIDKHNAKVTKQSSQMCIIV